MPLRYHVYTSPTRIAHSTNDRIEALNIARALAVIHKYVEVRENEHSIRLYKRK